MELGESLAGATVREIGEEAGLRVKIVGLLGIYSSCIEVYPNGDQAQPITTVFRCRTVGERCVALTPKAATCAISG